MPIDLDPAQKNLPDEKVLAMFAEVGQGMPADIVSSVSEVYFQARQQPDLLENGTGTFVKIGNKRFLISNAHVLKNKGVIFGIGDQLVDASETEDFRPYPLDLAISRVSDQDWASGNGAALTIPFERFATSSETDVPVEILWTAGYPGGRVKHLAKLSLAGRQILTTQAHHFLEGEVPHELFDSQVHFAVSYSPDKELSVDGEQSVGNPGLLNPPGLSGSLVWNTKRLACHRDGVEWNPSYAEVVGIVWGWSKNYLIATRAEALHAFLVDALQRGEQSEAPPQQP